jgi:diguanylate cyclase (GGDEF)-like protein/PAS domain S-box-containing protein
MVNTYNHATLEESAATLNALLDLIEIGTWDWTKLTGQVIRNPGWFTMLGYNMHEHEQDVFTWEKLIHPHDYDRVMDNIEQLISGITDLYCVEYRCKKSDGSYLWIKDQAKVITYDQTGRATRVIGYHTNIHAHKLAVKKLKTCKIMLKKDTETLAAIETKQATKLHRKINKLKNNIIIAETQSNTDPLTNIPNRKKFEEHLKKEIARSTRYNHPLSFVIFDIDFFKLVNDRFGHKTGDIVLKKLVNMTRSNIRAIDFIARWGGEEFVIILPCLTSKGAEQVSEKLRQLIKDLTFNENLTITCSFGVTEFIITDTVSSLFSRADKALYSAKNAGRDCVVINIDKD